MNMKTILHHHVLLFFLSGFLLASALAGPEHQELADRIQTYLDSVYPKDDVISGHRKSVITKAAVNITLDNAVQVRRAFGILVPAFQTISSAKASAGQLYEDILSASKQVQLQSQPLEVLKRCAGDHFQIRPEVAKFFPKMRGAQFGSTMEFETGDGVLHRFYIKSHMAGPRLSQSGGSGGSIDSTNPVDPYEIFIYKFLEYSGFGPEVHFFWQSAYNFYIATRAIDHGYATYAAIKGSEDSDALGQLLTGIQGSKQDLEQALQNPTILALVNGFIQAYVLECILGIHDLVCNDGNIFFCTAPSPERHLPQIIDFGYVDNKDPRRSARDSGPPRSPEPTKGARGPFQLSRSPGFTDATRSFAFRDFISSSQDSEAVKELHDETMKAIIRYFLMKSPLPERVRRANDLFTPEIISRLQLCIDNAVRFVRDLVNGGPSIDLAAFDQRIDELRGTVEHFFMALPLTQAAIDGAGASFQTFQEFCESDPLDTFWGRVFPGGSDRIEDIAQFLRSLFPDQGLEYIERLLLKLFPDQVTDIKALLRSLEEDTHDE
jgi:hypothetical protein